MIWVSLSFFFVTFAFPSNNATTIIVFNAHDPAARRCLIISFSAKLLFQSRSGIVHAWTVNIIVSWVILANSHPFT